MDVKMFHRYWKMVLNSTCTHIKFEYNISNHFSDFRNLHISFLNFDILYFGKQSSLRHMFIGPFLIKINQEISPSIFCNYLGIVLYNKQMISNLFLRKTYSVENGMIEMK